ncbi:MAG: T9SS type A sorting domain-containing protein [Bacteroidales bacterium]|nr:T9SS type A sorting domain-containing protein [Bacteroidales bacterium]
MDSDNMLFVKTFDDVPANAQFENEAEIELWLTNDHSYIELENQGAKANLAPGDSLLYAVKWFLSEIPDSVSVADQSSELAAFAQAIIKQPDTSSTVPNPVDFVHNTKHGRIYAYPNPAGNVVAFSYFPWQEANLVIFNSVGKTMLQTKVVPNSPIDISTFSHGLYSYVISTDKQIFTGKFLH